MSCCEFHQAEFLTRTFCLVSKKLEKNDKFDSYKNIQSEVMDQQSLQRIGVVRCLVSQALVFSLHILLPLHPVRASLGYSFSPVAYQILAHLADQYIGVCNPVLTC